MFEPAMGKDVFDWPEFTALAKRLGVRAPEFIQRMTIDIPIDGAVEVITLEIGEDHG